MDIDREIIQKANEDVHRRKKNKMKDWMSQTTWEKIEERRKA